MIIQKVNPEKLKWLIILSIKLAHTWRKDGYYGVALDHQYLAIKYAEALRLGVSFLINGRVIMAEEK